MISMTDIGMYVKLRCFFSPGLCTSSLGLRRLGRRIRTCWTTSYYGTTCHEMTDQGCGIRSCDVTSTCNSCRLTQPPIRHDLGELTVANLDELPRDQSK